jgi:hypothetical protein
MGTRTQLILTITSFAVLSCAGIFTKAADVDLTMFGEVTYRRTNFYQEGYDFFGGWAEARIALRNLAAAGDVVGVSPFVKWVATLTNHTQLPEENTFVYGVGIEIRFFPLPGILKKGLLIGWLKQIRLYGEHLQVEFLKRDVGPWIPRKDWRFGAEIWREFNVELGARSINPSSFADRLWAELWADIDWKKSNFFLRSFNSWTTGSHICIGARYPKVVAYKDIFLMPYAIFEHLTSQWRFPWQNRCLGGVGLRVMPFPHSLSDWIRRLKIFAEYIWAVGYLDDSPLPGTPDHDWRVGINFSNTWR